jgi:hypothetical protein
VKFFVDRFDTIIETGITCTSRRLQRLRDTNRARSLRARRPTNIIIVITRNERDRWCSGVIEDLDVLFLEHESKYFNVSYILDNEANRLGQKSIFTNPDGHSRLIPKWISLLPILTRLNNTYFTDISSLSKKSFWEKVCELDNTWPNLNEWWDDWSSFRNGISGPPDLVNPEQIKRKKLVSIVKDMLDKDTRLDFISAILDNNQETINHLKKTDKWI